MTDAAIAPRLANDRLLRALRREPCATTPVWIMRQAGRYDPEYQQLRSEAGLELEDLFRHPQYAARITMLPKRLGVDALIVFQDILTPLAPLGAEFIFRPGPVLDSPIRSAADIDRLTPYDPNQKLDFVAESLQLVRDLDGNDLPLLGFAGAPLTLAAFMIEGGSPSKSVERTKALMRSEPEAMRRLLKMLADVTADYLRMQVSAGANAIQLFESVADLFTRDEYEEFAHPYHQRIFERFHAAAPAILFVKEQPFLELMVESGADAISIGRCVDLKAAIETYGDRITLQGNVDNEILRTGTFDDIDRAVRECVEAGRGVGHILNLNHGVTRDTPIENVRRLIETCHAVTFDHVAKPRAKGD